MSSTTVPTTPSRGPTVTTVAVVFGVITVITLSLRLTARLLTLKRLGTDDILIIIAAALSLAFIIVTILAVQYGLGNHIEVVIENGWITKYAFIVYLSSIFYNATLGFIKTSVLCLYARLGDRNLTRMSYVMIAVVSCSAGANVLVCIFQCNPIAAAWNSAITHKTCANIDAFYLANAGTNIATDLFTYFLPIRTVLHLQMPRKQKIAVAVMLCLGLFACISSIIRITFIPKMLVSKDSSYAISNAMYWSVVETNIGILAASIPSLKPLVKRFAPKLLGEGYSSRNGHSKSAPFSHVKSGSRGFNKLAGNQYSYNDNKGPSMSTSVTAIDSNDVELSNHPRNMTTTGSMNEEGRVSNSSEEQIIKQNTNGIMRTTEVTSTVEDGSIGDSARTTTRVQGKGYNRQGQW